MQTFGMKRLGIMSFGAALLLSTAITGAQAQSQSGTAPDNQQQDKQSPPSTTTGQSTTDPATQAARDADSAKTQPLMATGEDLKGPPIRFPANKTPE